MTNPVAIPLIQYQYGENEIGQPRQERLESCQITGLQLVFDRSGLGAAKAGQSANGMIMKVYSQRTGDFDTFAAQDECAQAIYLKRSGKTNRDLITAVVQFDQLPRFQLKIIKEGEGKEFYKRFTFGSNSDLKHAVEIFEGFGCVMKIRQPQLERSSQQSSQGQSGLSSRHDRLPMSQGTIMSDLRFSQGYEPRPLDRTRTSVFPSSPGPANDGQFHSGLTLASPEPHTFVRRPSSLSREVSPVRPNPTASEPPPITLPPQRELPFENHNRPGSHTSSGGRPITGEKRSYSTLSQVDNARPSSRDGNSSLGGTRQVRQHSPILSRDSSFKRPVHTPRTINSTPNGAFPTATPPGNAIYSSSTPDRVGPPARPVQPRLGSAQSPLQSFQHPAPYPAFVSTHREYERAQTPTQSHVQRNNPNQVTNPHRPRLLLASTTSPKGYVDLNDPKLLNHPELRHFPWEHRLVILEGFVRGYFKDPAFIEECETIERKKLVQELRRDDGEV